MRSSSSRATIILSLTAATVSAAPASSDGTASSTASTGRAPGQDLLGDGNETLFDIALTDAGALDCVSIAGDA